MSDSEKSSRSSSRSRDRRNSSSSSSSSSSSDDDNKIDSSEADIGSELKQQSTDKISSESFEENKNSKTEGHSENDDENILTPPPNQNHEEGAEESDEDIEDEAAKNKMKKDSISDNQSIASKSDDQLNLASESAKSQSSIAQDERKSFFGSASELRSNQEEQNKTFESPTTIENTEDRKSLESEKENRKYSSSSSSSSSDENDLQDEGQNASVNKIEAVENSTENISSDSPKKLVDEDTRKSEASFVNQTNDEINIDNDEKQSQQKNLSRSSSQTSNRSKSSSTSRVKEQNASGSGSSIASSISKRTASITSQRKSSLPSLKNKRDSEITERSIVLENGVSSDSVTKFPPLISKSDESDGQEKNEITIENVEKLLLGTIDKKSNSDTEEKVVTPKSSSSRASSSSSASSRSSLKSSVLVPIQSEDDNVKQSFHSESPQNRSFQMDSQKVESPREQSTASRNHSSASSHQSSAVSSIGELAPIKPGNNRPKRSLRPQLRPKTPNSLKEYARNASREGMVASIKAASRRPTMDESSSVASRSRLAALDAGNLAGDAFVDSYDEDQVVLTRRLSTTVRQVLLGQHLPDHLKARHIAGSFITGVVSRFILTPMFKNCISRLLLGSFK